MRRLLVSSTGIARKDQGAITRRKQNYMPTWTVTPINGSETSIDVADYKADPKGVVLGFATNSDAGTETYHLAPEHQEGKLASIMGDGLGVLTNVAGAGAGVKLAEEAMAKFGGGSQTVSMVSNLAGAALGAFLAHTAEQSATKLYENHEIDNGDYYNSGGQKVFKGPIRVSSNGTVLG
jgi:hypothetical protein